MRARASRNVLAAVCMTAGTLMVLSAPIAAEDQAADCTNVVLNFHDQGERSLFINNVEIGPRSLMLGAGTYDIVMTSSDPTHAEGLHVDQLHESWYFTLDNGYTSPTTPDFDDVSPGVSILVPDVTLGAASLITAHWAGVAPSTDSVFAQVSFSCSRDTIPDTTTTTEDEPVVVLVSTTTTVATTTSSSAPLLPTTLPPTTPPPTNPPSTNPPSTTEPVGEIGGTVEENPELAATGMNLTLAVGGFGLVLFGFGLVVVGSYTDRRRLAMVRR